MMLFFIVFRTFYTHPKMQGFFPPDPHNHEKERINNTLIGIVGVTSGVSFKLEFLSYVSRCGEKRECVKAFKKLFFPS